MTDYTINWLSLANRFVDGAALMGGMMVVVVFVIWLTGGFKKKQPAKSEAIQILEDQINYLKMKLSMSEDDLRNERKSGGGK